MIQLHTVSKHYTIKNEKQIRALHAVDLSINKRDFITITGASGSGKSTLLFTIGGMLSPTEGRVIFDDADMYRLNQVELARLRRKRIGFVFQTFNLVPYLTCRENVALPAILNGTAKAAAFSTADEMLGRVGLGHRLNHTPAKMSVGERQRVALLRSLINEPDVILADEPTGNLDPATAQEVMLLLAELNQKGQTIVMVTHDHKLAEVGCRRITIEKGSIVKSMN